MNIGIYSQVVQYVLHFWKFFTLIEWVLEMRHCKILCKEKTQYCKTPENDA
jgi:hypothetical protein